MPKATPKAKKKPVKAWKRPASARKKPKDPIRKSKELCEYICEEIANGRVLSDVCTGPNMPHYTAVNLWSIKDDDFYLDLRKAYDSWFNVKFLELENLTTKPLSEMYPELDGRDAYEQRRIRMDALKFLLGKMAPQLCYRFAPKQEAIEVNHNISSISVIDYSLPKLVEGTIIEQQSDGEGEDE